MHLLSVQIQWMTLIKYGWLQPKQKKKNLVFDDMTTNIMSNKKIQTIIK